MNYSTLNTLNNILNNLKSDVAALAFTIAGLMIVVYTIMIMVTDDTNVAAHHKRWENLRKVFVCAAIIAAAGAIIAFGQQLGGLLH